MKYDESVVVVVLILDESGERLPEGRFHIGGVYRRVEGPGVRLEGELADFRDFLKYLAEVERLQCHVVEVLLHSDGPSRIDDEYRRFSCAVHHGCRLILKSFSAFSVVTPATSSTLVPLIPATAAAITGIYELSFLLPR